MSSQNKKFTNKKFTLARAEETDREDIKRIMESGSFKGGIEVQYLRGDDPLASFEKEGAEACILVVRDKNSGKAVGMGGCIIRSACVNGKVIRAGYLIALKFIPEYQHKVLYLPELYQYIYEETRESVDFYYSSILEENTSACKMLEKKHNNMPEYRFLDSYTVYFCKTGNFKKTRFKVKKCELAQVENFYTQEAIKYNMSYPSLRENDLENADFYGMYEDEKLLGVGYLLNQQDYKIYIIKGYSGIYKYISKLPTRILQYPSFPKKNQAAEYLSMGVMVKDNNIELAYELTQQILKLSPKKDFVMMGLLDSDPLNAIFSRIKNVKYRSRIYHVTWDKEDTMTDELKKKLMKLEGAFL